MQALTGCRWSFEFCGTPHLREMLFAFVGAHPCGRWHALAVCVKSPTGVGSYKKLSFSGHVNLPHQLIHTRLGRAILGAQVHFWGPACCTNTSAGTWSITGRLPLTKLKLKASLGHCVNAGAQPSGDGWNAFTPLPSKHRRHDGFDQIGQPRCRCGANSNVAQRQSVV